MGRVSEVVLVGPVGATTPALLMLLDAGVPLSFVTRAGALRGRLVPPSPKNLPLRHAQYDRARDPAFCLAMGRAIVDGKLRNSRALAYRLRRAYPQAAAGLLERIERAVADAGAAGDLDSLRGIEGSAAKAYFEVLRGALRADMTFKKRTRRPPRDPANALLSSGYTLLTQNMTTACEIVGLDPYDGFFHADKYGRPRWRSTWSRSFAARWSTRSCNWSSTSACCAPTTSRQAARAASSYRSGACASSCGSTPTGSTPRSCIPSTGGG